MCGFDDSPPCRLLTEELDFFCRTMNDKVSPVKLSAKAYYRVPVSWRAQAT